jgi:Protein of unknown function (DUF3467)
MPDNQQPQLESFRSDKFTQVYSNSTNLNVTPWDFTLTFGVLAKPSEAGKPARIENLVEVVMSPQHVKALLGILASNVQEYEKQVGEIKLPQPTNPQPPAAGPPAAAKRH